MTEAFYNWVGWSRENEWRAGSNSIFAIDSSENCREVAEVSQKLYANGHESIALSIAQGVIASAISTEILIKLVEHAFWNYDLWASVTEPSAACLKRRDFYFKKLEVATKEIHRRRLAGDKEAKNADWAVESNYVDAAARMNRIDEAMDMALEVPDGMLSYRAAERLVAKMFQLAIVGEAGQEAKETIFEKVMTKMGSEKLRNMVYTIYDRKKSAKQEDTRNEAMLPAGLLLFWYEKQGDFVEALNFLEDSHMGDDMKKHLTDNIATAGVCTRIANATIGAAFFMSLCIGLYSFTIHAATNTGANNGAPIFAWHTVPAVLAGIVLFHAIGDRDSVPSWARAWYLAKFWWAFLFFALPLFPLATSVIASVAFFFIAIYAYPRYRGWL